MRETEMKTPPSMVGRVGAAWELDFSFLRKKFSIKEEDDASLTSWIIEAPWAHFAWHSYLLTAVSLREMLDKRPTKFYLEGATHEIWLQALNPEKSRQDFLDGKILLNEIGLIPLNFAAQVIRSSDDLMVEEIRKAVSDVVDGLLNPDTDFVQQWIERFGDSMIKHREKRSWQ